MKVLVAGSGGREHAIALKINQSPLVEQVIVVPGNPGMSLSDGIQIENFDPLDISKIVPYCKQQQIDIVIVGPDEYLAKGLVSKLSEQGIVALGPTSEAARLESSKSFSKEIMDQAKIPTAAWKSVTDYDIGKKYLEEIDCTNGIVLKASELAAGKGVYVCANKKEGLKALDELMNSDNCGVKSKEVVIEEMLLGQEVSAFALCDGEDFVVLGFACDHKRIYEGNKGPNTGGMGTYSPAYWLSDEHKTFIEERVFCNILKAMKNRGTPFKGILFAGLMIGEGDPKLLEFNVRFGDPETQVLLPLIEDDLVPWFQAAALGNLKEFKGKKITMKDASAVHVVLAAQGYPGTMGVPVAKGDLIKLDNKAVGEGGVNPYKDLQYGSEAWVFFAGVRNDDNKQLVTSGGRVLGVTAIGKTIDKARVKAYKTLERINFKGSQHRKDIGI